VKRSFLPLRLKLTLWSALVFLVIQVVAAGVWVLVQRPFGPDRADRDLERNAQTVIARLLEPETSLRSRTELDHIVGELAQGPLGSHYGARIFTDDGTLYASSTDDGAMERLPFVRPETPNETQVEMNEVRLENDSRIWVRVATREFHSGEDRLFLQLATPAPASAEKLAAFWSFWFYSLSVGLVAAGLAAWWMAGRVVSPIQRLAKAARAVSPTSLEDRIDVDPADSEIARLQHELNDALGRLEKGYREQGSFISNVSHELKTPIAVLLSQAQVLKQGDRSPLEYRRFLAVVEEEMRILGRLVESFLVLARVGHGKELVRAERMLVNDVVLETAEHCAALSRHHDVPLVTLLHLSDDGDHEPEVEGDPELLRTMFENLVRNALRFSPRGEPVDLRVICTKDRASILVRDRGPGIPREHLERIFERFFQVTEAQAGSRGSGLGLAIAKSVAELHNGTISARNCADRGCEFEVLLPLCKPIPHAETPHVEPPVDETVAEDDLIPRVDAHAAADAADAADAAPGDERDPTTNAPRRAATPSSTPEARDAG